MNFSSKNRSVFISKAESVEYDLLVIGGGITGCGIALDAALRGMKVLLVEKKDFASGTSSRSTKLIHGGLRYLKQLEFKLVHDVGTERAIVHKLARHVVIPEKMLLPIYEEGTLGTFTTSMALLVYDLLAGVKSGERRKMLNVSGTLKQEPLLQANKLLGGGLYFEYRTDDSRLVIELAKSAFAAGALLLNYAEVNGFILNQEGKVCGAKVIDHIGGAAFDVKAKVVVNASGPWVDILRKEDQSLQGKRLQLTKGVHIVFPFEKFPIQQAAYFDVGDGRMIFAIPRNGITYLGTTDTVYNEEIDHPTCNRADVEYLLKAANSVFTSLQLKESDIVSSWAGLRPLIQEDGKSPGELSRKDEIFISRSGLISIAGGKLTGYRLMSEKIVDLAEKKLNQKFSKCSTADHYLSGGEFHSENDFKSSCDYMLQLANGYVAKEIVEEWFYRYGKNTSVILKQLQAIKDKYQTIEQACLAAEVSYALEHEMIVTPADFFIRRTGKIFFNREQSLGQIPEANTLIADYLSQVNAQSKKQLTEVQQEYATAVSFR
ncbi:MAG: glycerol-3-phosphate dehydrogenase/oxidase [Bacteroidetes bacterium]|nr:glycerol-3-phosphate dehydrogenase/oxidase [Bacteroidota bacterium]